jgi:type VII secretion-associated serine protease mycosin
MLTRSLTTIAAVALLALPAMSALPPVAAARADEIRDDQWPFLSALNVQRAWNVTKGKGVTVAVLDSGVDARQRDLAGSVTTGPDYTRGANPSGVAPQRLHGTQMASIVAGHGHGPGRLDGVIGVAPESKILSVRVLLENEEPGYILFNSNERYEDTIAKGIRYAVNHGADVINMSLGKSFPTKQERQAVAYAVSRGVVVVAAAGNEGASRTARRRGYAPYSYPASFPGVVSVAAVTADHRHAGFSNRNSAVVVSAPGVRVIAAGPGGDYYIGDGTSPATAFVSGVAALIRAKYPKLHPMLVTQAIVTSTAHRPRGGYDSGVGFGEVDAAAALEAAGKLSGVKTADAGLDPHFTHGDAGPVQVVHHDVPQLATYGGVGVLGLIITLVCAIIAFRRRRPIPWSAAPPQFAAPATWPPGNSWPPGDRRPPESSWSQGNSWPPANAGPPGNAAPPGNTARPPGNAAPPPGNSWPRGDGAGPREQSWPTWRPPGGPPDTSPPGPAESGYAD